MDNATRLAYLDAMGITVWTSRQSPIANQHILGTDQQNGQADKSLHPAEQEPANTLRQELLKTDWTELQTAVKHCQLCNLCHTRTQTVFGVGDQKASWLFIGEAPGQDEDLQGEPFVGKAGQLLNEMLRAIGLQRQQVYIANMLKCRPPKNRDPEEAEINACQPFLHAQIKLIQPKLIIAVGRIAAQNLLQTKSPLTKLRGVCHNFANIPLVVIHHPAYLLRSPLEKAKAWEDLQFALSVANTL